MKSNYLKKVLKKYFRLDDLSKKTRKRDYVDARKIFAKISYDHITKNMSQIGREIQIDHATIIYYLSGIDMLIRSDQMFRRAYVECENKFKIGTDPQSIDNEILSLNEEIQILQTLKAQYNG